MKLTKAQAEARYKKGMAQLIARHGAFGYPSEAQRALSDELRAFYIISNNPNVTARLLSQNMIPSAVAQRVMNELGHDQEAPVVAHKPSRKDRVKAMIKFAKEHHGEQFTTEQLVKVAGFCHATTMKFLNDNPYFHKIKRGLYEARDVAGERADARRNRSGEVVFA
jgi:hypothetical protein